MTFHSYGQYILYPWGYARRDTRDTRDLHRVGNAGANAVRQVNGRKYSVGSAAKMLYPAAGNVSNNRAFQLVVFNRGQKMALRAFYFIRALIKALTYYYIKRSQRHLLAATKNTKLRVAI